MQQVNDGEELKRIRQNEAIALRKFNRNLIFTKRRKIESQDVNHQVFQDVGSMIYVLDQNYRHVIEQSQKKIYQLEEIVALCNFYQHDLDPSIKHQIIIAIRKIITQKIGHNQQLIQIIIDSGCVYKIIEEMRQSQYPHIQFQACFIITNITHGSHQQCTSLVQKQCIDSFLQILYQKKPLIFEQALWGLGNIAGDCTQYRDKILLKGGVQCLKRIIENSQKKDIVKQGCWALSNLCRGSPAPKYQLVKKAVPVLAKAIVNQLLEGQELLDSLWAISMNTQGQKSRIQRVIQIPRFPQKIINLCFLSEQTKLLVPALRIIGNISTGNQNQTQQILNSNCLKLFIQKLSHPNTKKSIRRQICWIVSNIAAGSKKQVDQMLKCKQLVEIIVQLLKHDDYDVKKEICFIFSNMCHLGDINSVFQTVVDYHILEDIAMMILQDDDVKAIEISLNTIFELLNLGQKISQDNIILMKIQQIPGLPHRLQLLQYHESKAIYNSVVKILQRYFCLDEEGF